MKSADSKLFMERLVAGQGEVGPAEMMSRSVAFDLAKYFSNAASGRFVNGVLDHLAREARPAPVVATPDPLSLQPLATSHSFSFPKVARERPRRAQERSTFI